MLKKFFFWITVFLLSTQIISHQRSESYSKVTIDSQDELKSIFIEFSVQTSVLQRLNLDLTENWQEEIKELVTSNFNLIPNCRINKRPFLKNSSSTGYITLFWSEECSSKEVEINLDLFFNNDPTHTHIATFVIDSEAFPEKVFTSSVRNWKETDKQVKEIPLFQSFEDYLSLGFKHILSGFDHLAFLLALILLKLPLKKLILVITGFTVGHSITLAFGALGMLKPSSQLVEAFIGYSILIIALESIASITNLHKLYSRSLFYLSLLFIGSLIFLGYQKYFIGVAGISLFSFCYLSLNSENKDFSLTILVTALFGLIHGFGFAGNLSSLGLMEGRLIPAILGFNLGVEIGQILIIFALLLVFFYIDKFIKNYSDTFRVFVGSGLASTGTFWFFERLF
tara:strand:+ start:2606 stop:3796 length:1191 start_codon:yes stop_codon:yes gene_type:complete